MSGHFKDESYQSNRFQARRRRRLDRYSITGCWRLCPPLDIHYITKIKYDLHLKIHFGFRFLVSVPGIIYYVLKLSIVIQSIVNRVGFLPADTCFCQTWGLNHIKVVKTTTHGKKLDLPYLVMQTLYTPVMLSLVLNGWISSDKNCPHVRQR